MIIYASRRTDIPAFYSKWFFNRLNRGFVMVRNPFNPQQVRKISLNPQLVDCIVFWTKNPRNMLEQLDQLKQYHYYFLFTITSYGPELEKHFVVGYLHQRNTCQSPAVPVETLTIEQFVKDVHNVVEFMREKFNKDKIFLLGHSFGGILGYMYLLDYEDNNNIEKFVSAGGAFSAVSLEENGYKSALELAKKTNNQQALERLDALGPPPYETFQKGMVWRMQIMIMLNRMKEGIAKNHLHYYQPA